MLTTDQIQEKILAGESSGTEFKQVGFRGSTLTAPKRDDLSDEIAAFANSSGGCILFGVDDDQGVSGVENPQALVDFLIELTRDAIEPPVYSPCIACVFILVGEDTKKPIVYIEIAKSMWVHNSAGGYFYRHGNSKRPMTTGQLARLMQARSQAGIISFCEQSVPGTDAKTLAVKLWRQFIDHQPADDGAAPTSSDLNELRKRKLLVKDASDRDTASVAGVLMCCQRPREYITNAYIQAVCYKGTMQDANYQIDAKDFDGPLNEQIEDAVAFVDKHNQVSARKNIGREERPQYSMRAVFEAVVNAVVHRDYSIHASKIRLFVFSDRLEIYSPGALANTVTVDTLEYHQATRNELLARLLSECVLPDKAQGITKSKHFLEQRGEGVKIIYNESEKLGGKKPQYRMHGEELQLSIFAARSLQEDGKD